MARSFFVPLILSFIFLLYFGKVSNAQDIHKSKSSLVKGILQKVFNLTLTSFANIPIDEREKMMIKIEEKLNKSAQFLGPKSSKYVSLIMDGVRSLTSENDGSKNLDNIWDVKKSKVQDKKYKSEKQKKIGKKESIAYYPYTYAKIPEELESIVNSTKISETEIKKKTVASKQDAALANRDMIEQTMIRMTKNNAKINNIKTDSKTDDARRMEYEFIDNINVNKDPNAVKSPSIRNDALDAFYLEGNSNKIEPYYKNVTLKLPCLEKTTMICKKIKALRTIQCKGKDISVENLCNGIDDCFDYSDEHDCAIQGIDKIRSASQIMSEVEHSLSNNCYTAKIDDSLIAKQNEILRKVLRSQLKFIQKHATVTATNSSQFNSRKFYTEPDNIRKTVNELAVVISTLSSALERTLCSSTVEEESRKFNNIENIENEFDREESVSIITSTWSPNSCRCIEEFCVGECSENCESVCLQRYQISRWQCKAVSNKKSISLNLICDGKLDCYDEVDESGCPKGLNKIEAGSLYSLVLDMITTKKKSSNFEPVRNKLINLQILVENLQKLTSSQKPVVLEVKSLRDQCFSLMTAIYDQTRYYANSMAVMHDIYAFLMSLNDKLVTAMKHSHIGNDRIIAPDGCFCRDNKCALPKCSDLCNLACPAEPKLTRYFCGGSMEMNQSIPIEAICDGKVDCPGKDDEDNCSEDVCRKHHLVVLRHNLQEASKGKIGTTITEELQSWRIKVSATLRILESNERPSPKVLRDIVNDMLHDLVMMYASFNSAKRRNNDAVINQFYKTALVVMNSLRSCNK